MEGYDACEKKGKKKRKRLKGVEWREWRKRSEQSRAKYKKGKRHRWVESRSNWLVSKSTLIYMHEWREQGGWLLNVRTTLKKNKEVLFDSISTSMQQKFDDSY